MGGYFIGRPMDPESRPTKDQEGQKPSHASSHMGWARDKPTKAHDKEGIRQEGVHVQPGVQAWKVKT